MTINMSDNKEYFYGFAGFAITLSIYIYIKKNPDPPAYFFFRDVTGNTPIFFLGLNRNSALAQLSAGF